MKTTSKKAFKLFLVFVLILALVSPAFAISITVDPDLPPVDETGFNELTARASIIRYFNDRAEYLQERSTDLPSCNTPTAEDESKHLALLKSKEIDFVFSRIEIDAFHFDTHHATATVLETVTYRQASNGYSEMITHSIDVYPDENDLPLVSSDAYCESFSEFKSCSYVPPELQFVEPMAAGSRYCIVYTASKEIGYQESGENITKYGSWFGYHAEWCAMFVAWCANQANISQSVIPKTESAPAMKNAGTFFPSKSQGGTTTPQAGDLFFEGSSVSNISHVGIVQSVSGGYINVIDGNCENKVNSHTHALTSAKVVGYARPNYAAATHSNVWKKNAYQHWSECDNCAMLATQRANHSFGKSGGYYVCSTCGYKTSTILEPTGTPVNRIDLQK